MGKLTLSVDDRLIKLAKDWAQARGVSISQIVSTFFVSIGSHNKLPDEMPPVLRKIAGILQDEKVEIEDYHKYLEKKYL